MPKGDVEAASSRRSVRRMVRRDAVDQPTLNPARSAARRLLAKRGFILALVSYPSPRDGEREMVRRDLGRHGHARLAADQLEEPRVDMWQRWMRPPQLGEQR